MGEKHRLEMNVLYRNFSLSDYGACAEIWKENEQYTASKSFECIERATALNPGFQWIAEVEGKIVGIAAASFDGRVVFVYGLSVKREFQNNGIGTRLMEIIEELASKNGAVEILFFTKKSRENAKRFYKKRNYVGSEQHELFSKALESKSYMTMKSHN